MGVLRYGECEVWQGRNYADGLGWDLMVGTGRMRERKLRLGGMELRGVIDSVARLKKPLERVDWLIVTLIGGP
jgi:hypothetical protein